MKTLEADMLPIREQAYVFSVTKTNIQDVVSRLNDIQYHNDTPTVVQASLTSAAATTSPEFINAVKRISSSLEFFKNNSKTVDKLQVLNKKANAIIRKEFSRLTNKLVIDDVQAAATLAGTSTDVRRSS